MSDNPEISVSGGMEAPGFSVAREKVLEQRLVADLAVLMLKRGISLDVLRSEFDAQGHDVVLEAAGFIRHVQLKASIEGGARRHVDINVKLRSKPSGCVIWMSYDPETLGVTAYRWFGGQPGEPLPDLGQRVARHSKGDASGAKLPRPALRNVPKSSFEAAGDLTEIADLLFGSTKSVPTALAVAQMREQFGLRWRSEVGQHLRRGGFLGSLELAHLIDGYRVLEQLCVIDPVAWTEQKAEEARGREFTDDAGLLWTQLFLEHRRWRFASPVEPAGRELEWLDDLARRLIDALQRELTRAKD